MTDLIFWIVYAIGFLWGWRFLAGALVHSVTYDPDPVDYVMGALLSAILSLFAWPIVAFLRTVFVAWKKFAPEGKEGDILSFLYPAPKEIEHHTAKKLREKERELELYKAWSRTENAGKPGYSFEDYVLDQSM